MKNSMFLRPDAGAAAAAVATAVAAARIRRRIVWRAALPEVEQLLPLLPLSHCSHRTNAMQTHTVAGVDQIAPQFPRLARSRKAGRWRDNTSRKEPR
eukprot:COSAG06_NODE_169_length_21469_cov_23.096865_9_plen_97_part_00